MGYFVYILQSELDGSYYTGSVSDVPLRIQRHNAGWMKSTKAKRPWKVVHIEKYRTKSEALKREREIKRMKSRIYVEGLIRHAGGRPDA